MAIQKALPAWILARLDFRPHEHTYTLAPEGPTAQSKVGRYRPIIHAHTISYLESYQAVHLLLPRFDHRRGFETPWGGQGVT